ncbi:hypothetical protein PTKIN_Ptkin05aG0208800 [Pterospermum kingtungense]
MEHPQPQAVSICTLKVGINCCTKCQMGAKKKLQQIDGVKSVECDSKGVMTVSGEVNPMIIVKKIEKWGKKAELLSIQKSSKQDVQDTSIEKPHDAEVDKDCSCHCDAVSDSGSDSDDDGHGGDKDCEKQAVKPTTSNGNRTWQQQPDIPIDKQISTESKGKKRFLGLFSKKVGGKAKKLDGVTMPVNGPSKWQFPKTHHMPEYGGSSSRPYYQPFGPYRPPQPPPVIGRSSVPPYYPFGPPMRGPMPPALMPLPYGFFNSKPPPKVNPMIHYTSYADNYSPW